MSELQDDIQLTSTPAPATRGMRTRAHLACCVIFIGLFVLTGRLVELQLVRHEELSELADKQQYFRRRLHGRRGTIYDRRGVIIATSVSTKSVFADPSMVRERKRTTRELMKVLELPARPLLEKLRRECMFVWVKRHVTNTEAEQVRALHLPGVHLQRESKRSYPQGGLAGGLIGFTDIDGRGLAGIELIYDQVLAGHDGFEILRRDARQKTIAHYSEKRRPARQGYHILLTIDTYIQNLVEREVAAAVERHKASAGFGIVMDVRTGELLALASCPSFDPNEPGAATPEDMKMRPVTDVYEFGSVCKPITIAGALDAGVVRPQQVFDCENGAWRVGSRIVHDAHEYGALSVADIIAKSSNIGVAKACQELGPQGLCRWLKGFGLGRKTGIDLPGEETGLMLPEARWTRHTLISASFGQGIATTGLFVARAYAAIANGGLLVRPRVVKLMASPDGKYLHLQQEQPDQAVRVMKSATAAQVRAMLVRAVDSGTCKRMKMPEYLVGAKTGTAQLPNRGGRGYAPGKYLGSMCAIAPADDPRIVVLVSVREPRKGGYYGSIVAGPACRNIVRRTLLYLKVPPRTEPEEGATVTLSNANESQEDHEQDAI